MSDIEINSLAEQYHEELFGKRYFRRGEPLSFDAAGGDNNHLTDLDRELNTAFEQTSFETHSLIAMVENVMRAYCANVVSPALFYASRTRHFPRHESYYDETLGSETVRLRPLTRAFFERVKRCGSFVLAGDLRAIAAELQIDYLTYKEARSRLENGPRTTVAKSTGRNQGPVGGQQPKKKRAKKKKKQQKTKPNQRPAFRISESESGAESEIVEERSVAEPGPESNVRQVRTDLKSSKGKEPAVKKDTSGQQKKSTEQPVKKPEKKADPVVSKNRAGSSVVDVAVSVTKKKIGGGGMTADNTADRPESVAVSGTENADKTNGSRAADKKPESTVSVEEQTGRCNTKVNEKEPETETESPCVVAEQVAGTSSVPETVTVPKGSQSDVKEVEKSKPERGGDAIEPEAKLSCSRTAAVDVSRAAKRENENRAMVQQVENQAAMEERKSRSREKKVKSHAERRECESRSSARPVRRQAVTREPETRSPAQQVINQPVAREPENRASSQQVRRQVTVREPETRSPAQQVINPAVAREPETHSPVQQVIKQAVTNEPGTRSPSQQVINQSGTRGSQNRSWSRPVINQPVARETENRASTQQVRRQAVAREPENRTSAQQVINQPVAREPENRSPAQQVRRQATVQEPETHLPVKQVIKQAVTNEPGTRSQAQQVINQSGTRGSQNCASAQQVINQPVTREPENRSPAQQVRRQAVTRGPETRSPAQQVGRQVEMRETKTRSPAQQVINQSGTRGSQNRASAQQMINQPVTREPETRFPAQQVRRQAVTREPETRSPAQQVINQPMAREPETHSPVQQVIKQALTNEPETRSPSQQVTNQSETSESQNEELGEPQIRALIERLRVDTDTEESEDQYPEEQPCIQDCYQQLENRVLAQPWSPASRIPISPNSFRALRNQVQGTTRQRPNRDPFEQQRRRNRFEAQQSNAHDETPLNHLPNNFLSPLLTLLNNRNVNHAESNRGRRLPTSRRRRRPRNQYGRVVQQTQPYNPALMNDWNWQPPSNRRWSDNDYANDDNDDNDLFDNDPDFQQWRSYRNTISTSTRPPNYLDQNMLDHHNAALGSYSHETIPSYQTGRTSSISDDSFVDPPVAREVFEPETNIVSAAIDPEVNQTAAAACQHSDSISRSDQRSQPASETPRDPNRPPTPIVFNGTTYFISDMNRIRFLDQVYAYQAATPQQQVARTEMHVPQPGPVYVPPSVANVAHNHHPNIYPYQIAPPPPPPPIFNMQPTQSIPAAVTHTVYYRQQSQPQSAFVNVPQPYLNIQPAPYLYPNVTYPQQGPPTRFLFDANVQNVQYDPNYGPWS